MPNIANAQDQAYTNYNANDTFALFPKRRVIAADEEVGA